MNGLAIIALIVFLGVGGVVAYTYIENRSNFPNSFVGNLFRLTSTDPNFAIYHNLGVPDGAYGMTIDLFFANGTEVGGKGRCFFVATIAIAGSNSVAYGYVTSLAPWGNPALSSTVNVTGALVGSTGAIQGYETVLDKLRVDTLSVVTM